MSTEHTSASTGPAIEDPMRTERVGTAVADRLREHHPDLIACWDTSDDAVLAHVVARELGCALRLAVETEGIVTLTGTLPAGSAVALVGEDLAARNAVAALAGVVANNDARVVAVATAGAPAQVAGTAAGDAVVLGEAAG